MCRLLQWYLQQTDFWVITGKKEMKSVLKRFSALTLAAGLLLGLAACGGLEGSEGETHRIGNWVKIDPDTQQVVEIGPAGAVGSAEAESGQSLDSTSGEEDVSAVTPNGEIYILCTSDVHCGVDQGFGYAGLWQVRRQLEAQGYETILVDDGDAIQGEPIGTISKGQAILDLMNAMEYDVAIPGNHEFDYGMDTFLNLVSQADFPYISSNFTYREEPVFPPYVVLEAAGHKIGFVGVTTPTTMTSSTPSSFQDENGEFVYGFLQDESGEKVYAAVQSAVDAARSAGAELVYCLGHLGNEAECGPWTYAEVIANTNGIDVFLDGHSHDTDQVLMKNKDGVEVYRCAVGTKLSCIGYSHISSAGEVMETGIWSWPNATSMPELLNLQNEMCDLVDSALQELDAELESVVGHTDVELTIYDPAEKDASGNPIRMVRRGETNLGDLCADAYRHVMGADVAILNGGAIRVCIEKGDITYSDIIKVHPFGNSVSVVEVTGQQILDALEWGVKSAPGESGGFLQVSGISFDVNTGIDSPCIWDENSMYQGIHAGARRVSNVKVGEEPLDPNKTYTLASVDYLLKKHGDGYTMFDGCSYLQDGTMLDNQVLIKYIVDQLGGNVDEEYADLYGQGRIRFTE